MNHKEIRKGVTQAQFNEENSTILNIEILVISVFLGVGFQSWWVFGGIFLGLYIALAIKPLAYIVCVLLSLAWGAIGAGIGASIGSGTSAIVVLGLLGLFAGLGVHFSGLQWLKDSADN